MYRASAFHIAVDPVEFKRASALQFGATQAVVSIAEAAELASSFTNVKAPTPRSSPSA